MCGNLQSIRQFSALFSYIEVLVEVFDGVLVAEFGDGVLVGVHARFPVRV